MPRINQHARYPDLLPTPVEDIKAHIDAMFPDPPAGGEMAPAAAGSAGVPPAVAVALATKAIEHTLERVRTDHQVRRYIGAFSETFHLLTAALAEIQGKNVDRVRDFYCPGSAGVHRNYKGEA